MSALTVHPAATPAGPAAGSHRGRRTRHLQLVGPDFVAPAPARAPQEVAASRPAPTGTRAPLPARATQTGPLRLTRRGRRVLAASAFLCAAVFSVAAGTWAGQATGATAPVETTTVTVGPGESLWSVAEAVAVPGADVREVVTQIVGLNGLESTDVRVGQQLEVPQG
ncbi:LysM peptidoglycan-binding domain-containing protein [Georgenia deserti]|uniref:LysM peptidoglycan-binding domain-containing protein n=1 Tax=Georgenia deserti TaxID=2093781 RepID=A0ABW4L8W5_9MICO